MNDKNDIRRLARRMALSVLIAVVLLTCLLRAVSIVPTDVAAMPSISIPTITIIIDPDLWPVTIPDANLNAALHTACGKPLSDTLTRGDLKALTGHLNVSSKNIANLEGVQYCTHIERLTANSNPLSALPNMSGMSGLKYLVLGGCQFTQVPAAVAAIPNLLNLSISDNAITDTGGVNGSPKLQSLTLRGNKLQTLPASLTLPHLIDIDLSSNKFTTFPAVISTLSTLKYLYFNFNQIEELPAALGTMPNLQLVCGTGNKIRAIPDTFGGSKINTLYLGTNRISTLPTSLFDSDYLDYVDLSINRLTQIPSKIKDIHYLSLNLEFNYLDVAPGSAARTILDSVTAVEKYFARQLTPIKGLQASATENSIQVSWNASPDTETAEYYTKVKNYVVYLNTGGTLTTLATLDKATLTYTENGLATGVERKYTIAVVYDIVAPCLTATSTHYTSVTAQTAATASPTPTVTETTATETSATGTSATATSAQPTTTSAASASTQPGETTSPQVSATPSPTGDTPDKGGLSLPFILISFVALGGIATVVVLLIKLGKRT